MKREMRAALNPLGVKFSLINEIMLNLNKSSQLPWCINATLFLLYLFFNFIIKFPKHIRIIINLYKKPLLNSYNIYLG